MLYFQENKAELFWLSCTMGLEWRGTARTRDIYEIGFRKWCQRYTLSSTYSGHFVWLTFIIVWNSACLREHWHSNSSVSRAFSSLGTFPPYTIYIWYSVCEQQAGFCLKYLHLERQLDKAKQRNLLAFWEWSLQKMLFAVCWKHKVPAAGTGLVPGNLTSRE